LDGDDGGDDGGGDGGGDGGDAFGGGGSGWRRGRMTGASRRRASAALRSASEVKVERPAAVDWSRAAAASRARARRVRMLARSWAWVSGAGFVDCGAVCGAAMSPPEVGMCATASPPGYAPVRGAVSCAASW